MTSFSLWTKFSVLLHSASRANLTILSSCGNQTLPSPSASLPWWDRGHIPRALDPLACNTPPVAQCALIFCRSTQPHQKAIPAHKQPLLFCSGKVYFRKCILHRVQFLQRICRNVNLQIQSLLKQISLITPLWTKIPLQIIIYHLKCLDIWMDPNYGEKIHGHTNKQHYFSYKWHQMHTVYSFARQKLKTIDF